MTSIAAADIHLTTDPRDEERWGLLPWLAQQAAKHKAKEVLLLGDVTDNKDKHPAVLVNRVVDQLIALAQDVDVIWLLGNHDCIDRSNPFFGFLGRIPGLRVQFITKPTKITLSIGKSILLPNTATWAEDWAGIDFGDYDFAFAHQTFKGVKSETGYVMDEGIPPTTMDGVRIKAYSGDIHAPQRFGKKGEYIGAPYWVRFGDSFDARCLCIGIDPRGRLQEQDLVFPTKGKHLISTKGADRIKHWEDIPEGAAVKIRINVSRSDLPQWEQTKAEAKAEAARRGWNATIEMVRVDSAGEQGTVKLKTKTADSSAMYKEFCEAKEAPKGALEAGLSILESVR